MHKNTNIVFTRLWASSTSCFLQGQSCGSRT